MTDAGLTIVDWDAPPFGALAAAMAASQCGFWARAVALWRDQFVRGRYVELASYCAAEAALRSGQYDMADQMLAQLEAKDAYLAGLDEGTAELRHARIDWFGGETEAGMAEPKRAARQIDLALFADAARVARAIDPPTDESRALLVQALAGLGAYDLLANLEPPAGEAAPADEARARVEQLRHSPGEHVDDFIRNHPAGGLVEPELAGQGARL